MIRLLRILLIFCFFSTSDCYLLFPILAVSLGFVLLFSSLIRSLESTTNDLTFQLRLSLLLSLWVAFGFALIWTFGLRFFSVLRRLLGLGVWSFLLGFCVHLLWVFVPRNYLFLIILGLISLLFFLFLSFFRGLDSFQILLCWFISLSIGITKIFPFVVFFLISSVLMPSSIVIISFVLWILRIFSKFMCLVRLFGF